MGTSVQMRELRIKQMAEIIAKGVHFTAPEVAAYMGVSLVAARGYLLRYTRTGEIVVVTPTYRTKGGIQVPALYGAPGAKQIPIPMRDGFVQTGARVLRIKGADEIEVARPAVKPFRHWLDVAFFGPARVAETIPCQEVGA